MKILITGGAGFIGSHIVDMLKDKHEVVVLDDLSTGRKENIPDIKLIKKDVRDVKKEDIKDIDWIISTAAQVSTFLSVDYPTMDYKTNNQGIFNLFEAWRKWNGYAKMIFTSSRSVHGNIPSPDICDETFPYNPSTFYNIHKIYGEMLCKIYSELYGLKYVIIRPSNVYGPRQPYWVGGWYNFISHWIKLAMENKPIPIYGTGLQIRDYTFVEDTANAFVKAIKNKNALGKTFLLPTAREVNLNDLADMVIKYTNSKSKKKYFPPRKGDIQRFVGSCEKAKNILGWTPKVSLEEGLQREIEWLNNELVKRRKI